MYHKLRHMICTQEVTVLSLGALMDPDTEYGYAFDMSRVCVCVCVHAHIRAGTKSGRILGGGLQVFVRPSQVFTLGGGVSDTSSRRRRGA